MATISAVKIHPKGTVDKLLSILKDSPKLERSDIISDWIVRYGHTNPIFEETDEEETVKAFLLIKNETEEYWENLYIVGDSFGWKTPQYELTEVKGTRWWYLEVERPCGARLHYMLSPNEIGTEITEENREDRIKYWIKDHRNIENADEGVLKHSVLRFPHFQEVRTYEECRSKFSNLYLRNKIDGYRSAKIAVISKNNNDTPEKYLILHDGAAAIEYMRLAEILQAGVDEGRWPAIAVLALDTNFNQRDKEYGGKYGYPDFFADHIISAGEHYLDVSFDQEDIILAGCSLGGWAMWDVLWNRPDVAGNIIMQSCPFWWPESEDDGEKYIEELDNIDKIDIDKIYLDVGIYETDRKPLSTYASNLKFAKKLDEMGYEFMAREYLMGDRFQAWSWAIPNALDYIIHGEKEYGPDETARPMSYDDTD